MYRFALLLILICLPYACLAEVFHVTPVLPATQPCLQPCYTLDQYAQNTSLFAGHTNISLVFLDGVHILNSTLSISGINEISLQPQANNILSTRSSVIVRAQTNIILFSGQRIFLWKLTIHDADIRLGKESISVTISDCDLMQGDLNITPTIDAEIILHKVTFSHADLLVSSAETASAISVMILNCVKQYGSMLLDAGGQVDEFHVKIESTYIQGSFTNTGICAQLNSDGNYTLSIHNSSITQCGFGLHVRMHSDMGNMSATITNSMLFGNTMAGYLIDTQELFVNNSIIFQNEDYGLLLSNLKSGTIENSKISGNVIGAALINCHKIKLKNVHINNNDLGIVVMGTPPDKTADNGITSTYLKEEAIFQNCVFFENEGSSILVYQSSVELTGENMFYNNTAEMGAGLALYYSTVHFGLHSRTTFVNNTAKKFGGAIYISSLPPLVPAILTDVENWHDSGFSDLYSTSINNRECFYSSEEEQAKVILQNNTAEFGGMDIYGPASLLDGLSGDCKIIDSDIFIFDESVSSSLQVTSDPTRVCFCVQDIPFCENKAYVILNETRYPGETFNISVVLVGYEFGQVSGPVYTEALENFSGEVADGQHIQSVHYKQCNNLTYTVTSEKTNHSVILALTAQEQFTQGNREDEVENSLRNLYSCESLCAPLLTTPVYIQITLESCPLGFELNKTIRFCDCDSFLSKIRDNDRTVVKCVIQNRIGYVTRRGTVWIGVDTSENNTNIYYWHRYCPKDYCIPFQASVDLRSPDKQCNSNRSGVLCGKCQTNYSLQLGGNRCIQCSDSYHALLIVFAVLGIMLVVLIKLLDLTVTYATINGLIFYANVVWRNNAILFPLQDRQGIGYYLITVPIAWINLDFGIETCFTENLDQLTKTGLQFVFPVYLWCIAGLIIIISHYSTRATKLFGNNSVAVLSTLFLLSYGKLFRAITDVFAFADVSNSNGINLVVWSLDGNVQYGTTPGHIVLIVVALLFLILFLLPFTLTLLLVPFLRGKSHLRPLHWINKFKPFFDTYYGPFKDKKQHHVWIGILLISRVVILIVNASTSTSSPNANILLMTVLATSLLVYGVFVDLPYKKWYLSVLEILYLFNLIILGGAFLFYQTLPLEERQHEHLSPAPATSVCIALVQSICTLVFHLTKQAWPKRIHPREYEHISPNRGTNENGESDPQATTQIVEIGDTNKTMDSSAFRETLLA